MAYAFPSASTTITKDPSALKLKEAAEAIFVFINRTEGVRGILIGGAAAVLLGAERSTKDIDINVSAFPDYPDDMAGNYLHEKRRKGGTSDNNIRTLIYRRNNREKRIKCDISDKRADTVLEMYGNYTVFIPGLTGVAVAGHRLLLADKIRTYAERSDDRVVKKNTDIIDIRFCLDFMVEHQIKMDSSLRRLYTKEDWMTVRAKLEGTDSEEENAAAVAWIEEVETELHIIEPDLLAELPFM